MFIYYCTVVSAIFTAALYIYGTWTFDHFKKRKFPYSRKLVPFFGSMGAFVVNRTSMGCLTKDIYDEFKDHPLVGLFEFRKPTVMVRDPEFVKEVTVKAFDHFAAKENHRAVPFTDEVEPLLSKSLLGLNGDAWKDMRHTLSPAFTTNKLKGMFAFMTECGAQLCSYLEKNSYGEKDGVLEVEIKDLFTRYTNDVIASTAFGVQCDSLKDRDNEFYKAGKSLSDLGGLNAVIFFGFRISTKIMKFLGFHVMSTKTRRFLLSLVKETIAVREENQIVRPDLLHLMMEARKENDKLTNLDITAQAFVFILAGFDTASSSLCWLTNLIAIHSDVQQRLRDEIDATLADSNGDITYENIASMKYLDMCINEAMRLWPPANVTNRQCVKPYTFPATKNTPSITLRKGDGLWIPLMAIQRDPEYFPDPDKFDPERFSEERKHEILPYTYMPFGTGPRNCIGRRFALMETKIAISLLLSKFELFPSAKTSLSSMSELERKSFNMVVDGGFWVRFKPRTPKKSS